MIMEDDPLIKRVAFWSERSGNNIRDRHARKREGANMVSVKFEGNAVEGRDELNVFDPSSGTK